MSEILAYPYIVALDNGTSANGVALFGPDNLVKYEKLPIKNELSYTKTEHHISRLDAPGFKKLLSSWNLPKEQTLVIMERIMINPMRFRASISAARCLEAELVVIEELGYNIEYCDSKNWQHILLPDIKGSDELKKASLELGKKMFPQFKLKRDADPLLIGYWRKNKETLTKPKLKTKKTL
jgi:hypothetical protein